MAAEPRPLAQDALGAGVTHDAVHRQEIGRVAEIADQPQLVRQLPGDVVRQPAGVAVGHAVPHLPFQRLLRRLARRVGLIGILVAQLGQAEAAAAGDLQRAGHGVGVAGEQPRHLGRRLEVAVGEALAPEPGRVDGAALADAGEHVLEDAALRRVVEHVAGGNRRDPRHPRQVGEPAQPHRVPRPPPQAELEVAPPGEGAAQAMQFRLQPRVGILGQQDQQQPFALLGQVAPGQVAAAMAGAGLAERQQPAQAPVAGPVQGVGQHRQAVAQGEAAAHDQADADLLRPGVGAGDAGQAIVVGDGERLVPERLGLEQQFLDVAGAAQEGVVGGDVQLGVARHGGGLVVR